MDRSQLWRRDDTCALLQQNAPERDDVSTAAAAAAKVLERVDSVWVAPGLGLEAKLRVRVRPRKNVDYWLRFMARGLA